MKIAIDFAEEGKVRFHLTGENHEDTHTLLKMVSVCRLPVEAFGAVNPHETWAWVKIPARNRYRTFFNNERGKK